MNKIILFASLFMFIIISVSVSSVADWCNNADINRDGKVDEIDLSLLTENFGRTDCSQDNNWCDNTDINKNGEVDFADYQILEVNFGETGCGGNYYLFQGEVYADRVELSDVFYLGGNFEEDLTNSTMNYVSFFDNTEIKRCYFDTYLSEGQESFSFVCSVPQETKEFIFYNNGVVLYTYDVSTNKPVISNLQLQEIPGGYNVSWQAYDSDSNLSYYVFYSKDNDLWDFYDKTSGKNIVFYTSNLDIGDYKIRVLVFDGLNVAEIVSGEFFIDNFNARIYLPENNSEFFEQDDIYFSCLHDYDSSFWDSYIDGFLGSGCEIIKKLSLGDHRIFLEQTVGDLSSYDTINLKVKDKDSVPDVRIEGLYISDAIENEPFEIRARLFSTLEDNIFDVIFYENTNMVYNETVFVLANIHRDISFNWKTSKGNKTIDVRIENLIADSDLSNNFISKNIYVYPYCYLEDANGDGKVDGGELSLLGKYWFQWFKGSCNKDNSCCEGMDYNNDGKVDGSELALMGGEHWLKPSIGPCIKKNTCI